MEFKVEKVTNEIVDFIKDYYDKNNLGGAIIGISGGKDSAVCLALMAKAIGSENIVALWLPANSKETDKFDAIELTKSLNVELREFDLSKYTDDYIKDLKVINKVQDDDLTDVIINIKPRFRMLTLYSYAAMMTKLKKKNYIVVGTSNKSERFVGYFTKGGDGVSDIAPIADLYVDEVIQIGDYLNLPRKVVHKTPDDGLSGISDEERLGFTYEDVKKVSGELVTKVLDNSIDPIIREKIIKKHELNLHKFYTPFYQRNK